MSLRIVLLKMWSIVCLKFNKPITVVLSLKRRIPMRRNTSFFLPTQFFDSENMFAFLTSSCGLHEWCWCNTSRTGVRFCHWRDQVIDSSQSRSEDRSETTVLWQRWPRRRRRQQLGRGVTRAFCIFKYKHNIRQGDRFKGLAGRPARATDRRHER